MKEINKQINNSLKLQVIMNGVWDIEDAFDNNVSFGNHVSEQIKIDGSITEEKLLDFIHMFYDFNEFGGLTTDFISNLMEVLMPSTYVRMKFINEVQGEMLKKSCERINDKKQKVVQDTEEISVEMQKVLRGLEDPESKLRSYLNG